MPHDSGIDAAIPQHTAEAKSLDDRPRIIMLAQLPPPVHGVTVINQTLLESRLLERSFRLDPIPMQFANKFSDIGSLRPSKFALMAWIACRLTGELICRRPAAVYISLTPTGMSFVRDATFMAIAKLLRVRRIIHLHGKGIDNAAQSSPFYRRLYRWIFAGAKVIHLSDRLAADVQSFVTGKDLCIVPNGVPAAPDARPTGQEFSDKTVRLLFLSNILRLKGVFVLLDALEILRRDGVAFRADFAGAQYDEATEREFLLRCDDPVLRDHVRYHGLVASGGKDRLLNGADIFVLPTLNDAFPLVALEAMAYGLPAVCTDEGSLPDIVLNRETGFIVPKDDPEALAAALKTIIIDENLRLKMARASRDRYRQEFTLELFEQRMAIALMRCIPLQFAHSGAPHDD